ncbi:aminotransferase class I/II-fold pyridoxal phosphate-dependent enzyme [Streptomyces sp. NPDC049597]|uniref:aminotransferase class I/II-fold pyridoxal phosphate-dependent enzyme n=1 Tax=Streptomyces sp. NPDC049597 TaxID=3155276 RepID=UPI0034185650
MIDETITDIALDVPPTSPCASLAHPGEGSQVITIGSLSKSCWGGLRVGWLRAGSQVITELAALRITMNMASSVLDQLLALALLGRLDEVLSDRREQLRTHVTRFQTLCHVIFRNGPGTVSRVVCPSGSISGARTPRSSPTASSATESASRAELASAWTPGPTNIACAPCVHSPHVYDKAAERLAAALDGSPLHTAHAEHPHWVA